MQSKQFRNKTTGEIVTQFNIMDINNFEEVKEEKQEKTTIKASELAKSMGISFIKL